MRQPSVTDFGPYAQTIAIAAAVVLLALNGGGYTLSARAVTASLAWILLLLSVSLMPVTRTQSWTPAVTGGLLVAFVLVTGLSIIWAAAPDRAFIELDRVLLYLGIFAAVVILAQVVEIHRWLAGTGTGITVICALALIGRCFPATGLNDSLHSALPSIGGRLTYPLGYWNGLGIFAALGIVLLLGVSLARPTPAKALSASPIPALVATIYLTSSRGAVAVAIIGTLVLVACSANRADVLCGVFAAGVGSAVAIIVLVEHRTLVNAPWKLGGSAGSGVAALLILACAAAASVRAGLSFFRTDAIRPSRPIALSAALLALVALIIAIAAAQPGRRLDEFKAPPQGLTSVSPDFVRSHLLSAGGSGRWQFWTTAVDEFRAHPLRGGGAGSYQAWWTQHGPFSYNIRDAHSLWLQVLGELGLLGFLPLALAFVAAIVLGVRQLARAAPLHRASSATCLAVLVGWMVGAGIDWIWELTAVGVIGVIALALLSVPGQPFRSEKRGAMRSGRRLLSGAARPASVVGLAGATVVLIAAQVLPWLVQREISASQAAARAHNWSQALARGQDARALQPWAAGPYVQLALANAAIGDGPRAVTASRQATEHARDDWRAWLVEATVADAAGMPRLAQTAIAHARVLNPRSPLLRGSLGR